MRIIVFQYILVVLLIVGIAYFIYLIKDNEENVKDDYYGIIYTLLRFLDNEEATTENIKKILRVVYDCVSFVEENFKNEDNFEKEEKALSLAKEGIENLEFNREIDEESLVCIIRIATALMKPTKDDLNI
ncbi:hypothetical protein IRP63_05145 [Clostridium botulinum]|uniref:Membrane protein n=1 Tax=Clostridium botulinum C/D str. DC5 TaxID=1443128 RepID=A0A0A0IIC4_CLOBO|nr:hypothetical protein [Clostridium botulinum]KEI01602.1 membrane protein [Clostridium botulinum C/D str. BKT75002]KEI07936.1 membrane protein [Clostridium botulinum C/D str. BKT2873]KGM94270.1 membrane protein [Clostridium botulinum D str. CCUG 7971]KGN00354.1 membrane protein [Clostridium botulinum C/D str. DC5]KOC50669.1 hypothetical protein ADU88_01985 [Clostridium botulinum]